jgi:hypothetical protein
VDDVRDAARRLLERLAVEHVPLDEREVGVPREVGALERVPMQVVERDDRVRVDESPAQRRADEAGAAGDQDPLALEHAGESIRRPETPPAAAPGADELPQLIGAVLAAHE